MGDFSLARRLSTPVWVYDIDRGRVAHANRPGWELWRAESEAELQSRDLHDGMSSTVSERMRQYQRDFIDSDTRFSEVWTLYPKGEPVSLKVMFSGFEMPDRRMAMLCEVIGFVEDEPATLRSAEALLHTDVMISLFAIDGALLYANPAARDAMPEGVHSLKALYCENRDYDGMQRQWNRRETCRRVTRMRTARGIRWLDMSVKPCLDAATGDSALLVTAVDVSELKDARDKARYLADRDQLTGCFNRSFITQRLENIGLGSERPQEQCAVLFLDIDKFKGVNDQFGHEVGDKLLQAFAQRIQGQIRESDILARVGGDEFIVLLEGVSDPTLLNERLEAMKAEINKPIDCGTVRLNITSSIGVSLINAGSALEWSEIIKQADIALYTSKRAGRNRHTVFNEALGAEVSERAWLESEVKKAFETDAFSLHFQPRIDVATGRIVAAEALARWLHPERGYIGPDIFIPVCEDTGLIDALGAFVLRKTGEHLLTWQADDVDLDLSLNVSPTQFRNPSLVESYRDIMASMSLPAQHIELEITESSLLRDDPAFREKIASITDLGFRLALDDFGTGYSNLAYISRFPLRCIKLDMSFVQQLPESGPLLRLILTLAREIGATTVAEGVETREQLRWLVENGCDQIQGFLFSKPLDAASFRSSFNRIEDNARGILSGFQQNP